MGFAKANADLGWSQSAGTCWAGSCPRPAPALRTKALPLRWSLPVNRSGRIPRLHGPVKVSHVDVETCACKRSPNVVAAVARGDRHQVKVGIIDAAASLMAYSLWARHRRVVDALSTVRMSASYVGGVAMRSQMALSQCCLRATTLRKTSRSSSLRSLSGPVFVGTFGSKNVAPPPSAVLHVLGGRPCWRDTMTGGRAEARGSSDSWGMRKMLPVIARHRDFRRWPLIRASGSRYGVSSRLAGLPGAPPSVFHRARRPRRQRCCAPPRRTRAPPTGRGGAGPVGRSAAPAAPPPAEPRSRRSVHRGCRWALDPTSPCRRRSARGGRGDRIG